MNSQSTLFLRPRREPPSHQRQFLASTILLLLTTCLSPSHHSVQAIMASPETFFETQPNGQVVELKLNGDPYDAWMSDVDGYTVVKDFKTGSFVYAQIDKHGHLRPSHELVISDPHSNRTRSYLKMIPESSDSHFKHTTPKHLRPTKRGCNKNVLCREDNLRPRQDLSILQRLRGSRLSVVDEEWTTQSEDFPTDPIQPFNITELLSLQENENENENGHRNLRSIGTLRNLVVLLQWGGHSGRNLPTPSEIDVLMNNDGPHPSLCPTGSVRDVFRENSYGALRLESTITDWILLNNTERYFADQISGRTQRIWEAISYALEYLDANNLVDFDYFDADRDGTIDSITFLHSGYGAEFGGTDQYGTFYEDRIWSHKWALHQNPFVSQSGVQVFDYHISSSLWSRKGSTIGRIGVIAHETGHFLGVPDLYDTDGGGLGVGNYDLMGNSWGWDGSQLFPPHMSAWTKLLLGWTVPYFPTTGLNRIAATEIQKTKVPQVYAITEGFPPGEFLLIENRQRKGFDVQMPQSGIMIYHIDHGSSESEFRNSLKREGYLGQGDWPENGNHYGVAVAQADGRFDLEQSNNAGDAGDFFHAGGVSQLIPCKHPEKCNHPNTDSYQNGIIAPTNIFITDISFTGDEMTFQFRSGEKSAASIGPVSTSSSSPSEAPSNAPKCLDRGQRCVQHDNCCSGYCVHRTRRFLGVCSK